MSKEYNLAGKSIIIDDVTIINGSTKVAGTTATYLEEVKKSAQQKKDTQDVSNRVYKTFKIIASPTTLERDDESTGHQIVSIKADINDHPNAVPRFEFQDQKRICAWSSGLLRSTVISDLESKITNHTPFTPNYSGTGSWSRGGGLFSIGDTVSVIYFFSDLTYATAIMTVTSKTDSTITGTVTAINYRACDGFDDRDAGNTKVYVPYRNLIPFDAYLYDGDTLKDSLSFEVVDNTRNRKAIGESLVEITSATYTEDGVVKNYIEGDCYVYVQNNTSTGEKIATVKVFHQGSWMTLNNVDRTYQYYDVILTDSLPSVFSLYAQGTNHVTANGYDWFQQIIAKYISAVYYYVAGAIYGGKVSIENNQPVFTGKGFYLGADGKFQCQEATFTDCNVSGRLDLTKVEGGQTVAAADIIHPAITTVPGTSGDPNGVSLPAPSMWSAREIFNAIPTANSVLTCSGTYSKIIKLSDINAQMYAAGSLPQQTLVNIQGQSGYYLLWQADRNCNVSISGLCPYVTFGGFIISSMITIKINNVSKYQSDGGAAQTPVTFSTSLTVAKGDTITLSYAAGSGSQAVFYDGNVTLSYSASTFVNEGFNSVGLWGYLDYEIFGGWEFIDINLIYPSSKLFSITIGSQAFNKVEHYALVTNFATYSYGSMTTGRTYRITSSQLTYNGDPVNGVFLTKITATTASLVLSNGTSISLQSGGYAYLQGSIKLASTDSGVEMMGQYPVRDADAQAGGFDIGTYAKRWDTAYIKNVNYINLVPSSKRSLKENINDYERSGLDIINNTKVVSFNYIRDKDKTYKVGFIADDTDEDIAGKNHDVMDVNNCIGVLMKAIQELSAEIAELKRK